MGEAILHLQTANRTIQELFEKQVEMTPDNIAIVFKDESITYRELNRKSNILAWELKNKGIGPNKIVGILQHRSIPMLISFLAVIKAGGAYLPIDPQYPEARVNFMIDNSKALLLLVDNVTRNNTKYKSCLNVNMISYKDTETKNPQNSNEGDNLLYIIYTSGSTGEPKGVMILQHSVVNLLEGVFKLIDFRCGKSIISATTICFDIFVLEFYLPLVTGMTIYLADEDEQIDAEALSQIVITHNINMIQTTPSRYQLLLNNSDVGFFKVFTEILVGGEMLPIDLLKELQVLSNSRIYNMYGPTETTVWSTIKELTNETEITVGKPIQNTQCYILDNNLQKVDIGMKGELYIGGAGLARGYLYNQLLTEQKFIVNPFDSNSKIYRTGDIAQFTDKGEIAIYGRTDSQIKIRGYRVELGEIESRLKSNNSLVDAALIIKKNHYGNPVLYAFIVKKSEITTEEIKEYLSINLPGYMIPNFFIEISDMPLTPNGKMDKRKLSYIATDTNQQEELFMNQNEMFLDNPIVILIKDILGISFVDTAKTFIQLGGDSLSAATLISQLSKRRIARLSISEVLSNKTIESIIETIDVDNHNNYSDVVVCEEQSSYPISCEQHTFFIASLMYMDTLWYNIPSSIHIIGDLDISLLEASLTKLAMRHQTFRIQLIREKNIIRQTIHNEIKIKLEVVNCREESIAAIEKEFVKPFKLLEYPLFRLKLLKLDNTNYVLLMDMHHIICDGTSLSILIHDLADLYSGKELEPLRNEYKDYVIWQKKLFTSKYSEKQNNYWTKKLSGKLTFIKLPIDYRYRLMKTFTGANYTTIINKKTTSYLLEYSKDHKVTMNTLLFSCYGLLLHKLSEQNDILLGSYCSFRCLPGLEKLIGVLGNFIPIRLTIHPHDDFSQFVEKVNVNLLESYDNINYDFNKIIMKKSFTILKNIISGVPNISLFNHALVYHNEATDLEDIKSDGIMLSMQEIYLDASPLDTMLHIYLLSSGELKLIVQYNSIIFKEETISYFMKCLEQLILLVLSNPKKELCEYKIFAVKELNIIRKKRKKANHTIYLSHLIQDREGVKYWAVKLRRMLR